jgi:hypothetical protein
LPARFRTLAQPPQMFRGERNSDLFSVDPGGPNRLGFSELHPQAAEIAITLG